jgi:hypothetical protein
MDKPYYNKPMDTAQVMYLSTKPFQESHTCQT